VQYDIIGNQEIDVHYHNNYILTMKYFLKAITTNNRDLKTSIYLSFEEKSYLFNVPDGFQRMALN